MWLLLESLSLAAPDCAEIHRVHGLLLAEHLDDSALVALERRLCAPAEAPPAATADCRDLRLMAALGRIAGSPVEEAERSVDVTCALGVDSPSRNWSSGLTAKYSNGAWNYPSGNSAKYSNGAWNYPSGNSAKYSNGAWNYPSGNSAKYSNGQWNFPDGHSAASPADLLTWACARTDCADALRAIKSTDDDVREAAIIEVAWRAAGH